MKPVASRTSVGNGFVGFHTSDAESVCNRSRRHGTAWMSPSLTGGGGYRVRAADGRDAEMWQDEPMGKNGASDHVVQ